MAELGWRWRRVARDDHRNQALHQALLAGLLGNIGVKEGEGEGYQGARGIRFHLHPGSGLAKKRPKWVLAAELVETSRLYARCAGALEPEWIERTAGDRVTRDYFEPHWDPDRGGSSRASGATLRDHARRAAARFVRAHRSRDARQVFIRGSGAGRARDRRSSSPTTSS